MKKSRKTILIAIVALLTLCIGGIAAMVVIKICPPEGPWPQPPWCENSPFSTPFEILQVDEEHTTQSEFIAYGEGLQYLEEPRIYITWAQGDDVLEKIPSTDFMWTVIWRTEGNVTIFTKQEIRDFQKQGVRYVGYLAEPVHQWDSKPLSLPDFATVDIDGNLIHVQKPGMGDFASEQYWMNQIDPGWQDFLINQTLEVIDLGIEGVLVDEATFNAKVIELAQGTFDDISNEKFTDYLRNKYTTEQLNEYFGILDINQFNLKDYILTNLSEDWNTAQPPSPMVYEFQQFQLIETDAFYRKFYKAVKEYGEQNGRHIFFTISIGEYDLQKLPTDYLDDYITGEEFYFSTNSRPARASTRNKLLEGFAPYRIVRVEIENEVGYIPLETDDLFKYIFADIYSSGGRMIVEEGSFLTMYRDGIYVQESDSIKYDIEEAAKYVNFAVDHKDLFNLEEPATVAVVRSEASIKGGNWAMPVEERNVWTMLDVGGVADMLLNLNIPFNMLYSGDEDLFMDRLTLDELQQYEVVIFPAVFMLSDSEVDAVIQYVNGGGRVLMISDFATHDLYGHLATRNEITPYRNAGQYNVGNGIWLTVTSNLGEKYLTSDNYTTLLPTNRESNDPILMEFQTNINKLHQPEITTDAPTTVNIRRYGDSNRLVLHIVNYDFDEAKDEFSPTGDISMNVDTEGLSISQAIVYDFETGTIQNIPVSMNEGLAEFIVPSVYAYSIVELLP